MQCKKSVKGSYIEGTYRIHIYITCNNLILSHESKDCGLTVYGSPSHLLVVLMQHLPAHPRHLLQMLRHTLSCSKRRNWKKDQITTKGPNLISRVARQLTSTLKNEVHTEPTRIVENLWWNW